MTRTIRTLRKECTYKNEKYKVEVKKIFYIWGNYYEIKIRKRYSIRREPYVKRINGIDDYQKAVEKAFEYYEENFKKKECEEAKVKEFKLWNGVIEQCST